MKPLWGITSGRFLGWCSADGQLYDAGGDHIGYFVDEIAYSNAGRVIGEIYEDRWLGKRPTVIYPSGSRNVAGSPTVLGTLADRDGLGLAGWWDPEV